MNASRTPVGAPTYGPDVCTVVPVTPSLGALDAFWRRHLSALPVQPTLRITEARNGFVSEITEQGIELVLVCHLMEHLHQRAHAAIGHAHEKPTPSRLVLPTLDPTITLVANLCHNPSDQTEALRIALQRKGQDAEHLTGHERLGVHAWLATLFPNDHRKGTP